MKTGKRIKKLQQKTSEIVGIIVGIKMNYFLSKFLT